MLIHEMIQNDPIDKKTFYYLDNYIKGIEKDMGYIKREYSTKPRYKEYETIKNIKLMFFEIDTEHTITKEKGRLIKLKDDLYALEEICIFEDDCKYIYEFFSKEIDNYKYNMLRIANKLKDYFFTTTEEKLECICMECLSKKHWLENEGDLLYKLKCLERGVCSNCLKHEEIRKEYGMQKFYEINK